MSSVISLRTYVDSTSVPTLVLVDLQQEYIASTRALAMREAIDALAKCGTALRHARMHGFPVAFVRWLGRSPFFNAATPFSKWIEGFEPRGSDMVFERDRPSCYASEQFAEVMKHSAGNLVIAGFAGEAACLSTAVDAFHRGHRFTFLADASASHRLDEIGAAQVHRTLSKVISLYGDTMTTGDWIAATTRRRSGRAVKYEHDRDGSAQRDR